MEEQRRESDKKGVIVGVGNVLQRDDGIGVKVLKYLEAAYRFPENVDLIDGGTTGAGLQSSVMGKDWLIIIDALAVSGNPGDVHLIPGGDVMGRPSDLKLSPHQVSFFDLIQFMELNGSGPEEFCIIGIVPENTDVGTEISPSVEGSIKRVADCLLGWLKEKGIAPEPVSGPVEPDYWWLK